MGVSKNRGTSKWMVKIMENPIKMDDMGGKPTIFGNIQINTWLSERTCEIPCRKRIHIPPREVWKIIASKVS